MKITSGISPFEFALPLSIEIDDGILGNWSKCVSIHALCFYIIMIWD